MARQGLPCTEHVTLCLEGREADLISINCEWPAGMLGPHMVFLAPYPRGPAKRPVRRRPGAHDCCEMRGDNRISHALSQCS